MGRPEVPDPTIDVEVEGYPSPEGRIGGTGGYYMGIYHLEANRYHKEIDCDGIQQWICESMTCEKVSPRQRISG